MKLAKVGAKLTTIDSKFASEVPNLEELSVSGHELTEIDNLPPNVIILNAHCNKLTAWPTLPNMRVRHLGLSGNLIASLGGLPLEVAALMSNLFSLDLSSNRWATSSPPTSLPISMQTPGQLFAEGAISWMYVRLWMYVRRCLVDVCLVSKCNSRGAVSWMYIRLCASRASAVTL